MIRNKIEYATKILIDENGVDRDNNDQIAEKCFERYLSGDMQVDIVNGNRYDLQFVGEGATSVCYTATSGNRTVLIKEFFPITYTNGIFSYFTRDSGQDKMLKLVQSKDAPIGLLKERYKRFLSADKACNAVANKYSDQNATIAIKNKLCDSSLNLCYLCDFVGGKTLEQYWKENNTDGCYKTFDEFSKILLDCVELIYRAVLDIKKSHDAGYLNADIKPDNLWVLNMDDARSQRFVRNLDFGSFIDTSRLGKVLEPVIKKGKTEKIDDDTLMSLIGLYFESSIKYYPMPDLMEIISRAIYAKNINDLFNLDWFALFRCMLIRILGEVNCEKRYFTYLDARNGFRKIFADFPFDLNAYDVLHRLEKIIYTVYMELKVEGVEEQLLGLLNVLNNAPSTKEGLLSREIQEFGQKIKYINRYETFKDLFKEICQARSTGIVMAPYRLIMKNLYQF